MTAQPYTHEEIAAIRSTDWDDLDTYPDFDCIHGARWLATLDAVESRLDAAVAKFKAIAALRGMTLLGPDSCHHMGDDAPRYHEMGAAAAYEQVADIADAFLRAHEQKGGV